MAVFWGGWAGPDQHFIPKSLTSNYSGNAVRSVHMSQIRLKCPFKQRLNLQVCSNLNPPLTRSPSLSGSTVEKLVQEGHGFSSQQAFLSALSWCSNFSPTVGNKCSR